MLRSDLPISSPGKSYGNLEQVGTPLTRLSIDSKRLPSIQDAFV
jgi:hypothetical protein